MVRHASVIIVTMIAEAIILFTELFRLADVVRKRFCSPFSISSSCLRLTSRALRCLPASLLLS